MAHQSELIKDDINAYLKNQEEKSLLRFITCGSVDDGKSTLIGRLLWDSKLIFEDQLAALKVDSKKVGTQEGDIDYALLLDGLQAEREQGITIDVAYRFFSTDKRKFIVADTPGHEQYTRNMATGASSAETINSSLRSFSTKSSTTGRTETSSSSCHVATRAAISSRSPPASTECHISADVPERL